jgi:hypothetical protein
MSGLPSNLNVTATRPGTEPNGLTYWVNDARTRPPEKILRKKTTLCEVQGITSLAKFGAISLHYVTLRSATCGY